METNDNHNTELQRKLKFCNVIFSSNCKLKRKNNQAMNKAHNLLVHNC